MRIEGDATVNLALDSRLERESQWTTKYSTICECDQIIQKNIENDRFLIPTTKNTFDVEISRTLEIPKAKLAVKKSIKDDVTNLWNSKV